MKHRLITPLVLTLGLSLGLVGCTSVAPTAAVAPLAAAPYADYLTITQGTLPLVFSVPHGGNVKLLDAPERAKGTKVQDDRVSTSGVIKRCFILSFRHTMGTNISGSLSIYNEEF